MKAFDMAFCYMVFTLVGIMALGAVLNIIVFIALYKKGVITRETISNYLL